MNNFGNIDGKYLLNGCIWNRKLFWKSFWWWTCGFAARYKKKNVFVLLSFLIKTLSGIRFTLRIWILQDIDIHIYLICIFKVLENPCFLIPAMFKQNGKFFLVIYNLLLLLMVNRTFKTFENVFIKRSQYIHSNLKLIKYIFKWKDLDILV